VTDDEWSLVVPYLTLVCEEAPQRAYPLQDLLTVCATWRGLAGVVLPQTVRKALAREFAA
jgi:hypothetical protein